MKRFFATVVGSLLAWGSLQAADSSVTLKDAKEKALLSFKSKDNGYKLVDGSGKPVGKLKVEADRVKLKDASDAEIWKVKRKSDGVEVEDGSGGRVYKLKPRGSDWKVEDAGKNLVWRVKAAGGGFELLDASGKTVGSAGSGPGSGFVSLKGRGGAPAGTLQGTTNALAGVWFAAENLSLGQRAALFAYFSEIHK